MPTLGPMCTDGTMCSLHMNFPPFLLGKTCLMCIFRDQNGAGLLGNHTASNEAGIRKSEIRNRLGLGIFGRPKLGLRQDMVLYQAYTHPPGYNNFSLNYSHFINLPSYLQECHCIYIITSTPPHFNPSCLYSIFPLFNFFSILFFIVFTKYSMLLCNTKYGIYYTLIITCIPLTLYFFFSFLFFLENKHHGQGFLVFLVLYFSIFYCVYFCAFFQ